VTIVNHSNKWLPMSAIEDGKIFSWLSSSLEKWYEAWGATSSEKTLSIVEKSVGNSELVTNYFIINGAGIKIATTGYDVLAEEMIALSLRDGSFEVADKTLLKGMVVEALADLLNLLSIDAVVMQEGKSTERWVSQFEVSIGQEIVFELALPMELCVLRRKALALPVKMESLDFGDIQTAVSTSIVNLDARVGEFELDIEKITQLKIGDIIELDKTLAQGFPLRANGKLCDNLQARFVLTQVKKGARKRAGFILEKIDE